MAKDSVKAFQVRVIENKGLSYHFWKFIGRRDENKPVVHRTEGHRKPTVEKAENKTESPEAGAHRAQKLGRLSTEGTEQC